MDGVYGDNDDDDDLAIDYAEEEKDDDDFFSKFDFLHTGLQINIEC